MVSTPRMILFVDIPSVGTGNNATQQCSCINDCTVVNYPSAISTSQLVLNPSVLLKSGNASVTSSSASSVAEKAMTSRLQFALEISDRVEDSVMTSAIALLMKAVAAHQKLGDTIRQRIINSATSVSAMQDRFWTNIIAEIKNDLMFAAWPAVINPLRQVYRQYVAYVVSSLSSELLTVSDLVARVQLIVVVTVGKNQTLTASQSDTVRSLVQKLEDAQDLFDLYETVLQEAAEKQPDYFPEQLIVGDVCLQTKRDVSDQMGNVSTLLKPAFDHSDAMNVTNDTIDSANTYSLPTSSLGQENFVQNCTALHRTTIEMSNCLNSYGNQLDDLATWLNSTSEITYVASIDMSLVNSLLSQFDIDYAELSSLYEAYVSNETTKRNLSIELGTQTSSVLQNAQTLVSNVEANVLNKLTALTDTYETTITAIVSKWLESLVNLESFLSQDDLTIDNFARYRSIWRMPTISIQDSQVKLSETQTGCFSSYMLLFVALLTQLTFTELLPSGRR